jgi:nitrite reductase/ring-hydroxylating ferredoxin subunit
MLAAARLGGGLVYRHLIGTDHAPADSGPEEFTPVMSDSDLSDDHPRRANLNGIPIVLIKSGGNVFALGEKCAHLGGPLSEGKCESGIIECPWHGSQFGISDGHVVHGPSVHPQLFFDARVRDG